MQKRPIGFLISFCLLLLAVSSASAQFSETADAGDIINTALQDLGTTVAGAYTLTGVLDSPLDVDAYEFTLDAADAPAQVTITMRKAADDLALYVLDDSNVCLGWNDDSDATLSPSINLGLVAGTYRFVVVRYDNYLLDADGDFFDELTTQHLCNPDAGPLDEYEEFFLTDPYEDFFDFGEQVYGGGYEIDLTITPRSFTNFTAGTDPVNGTEALSDARNLTPLLVNGDNVFRATLGSAATPNELDTDIYRFRVTQPQPISITGIYEPDGISDLLFTVVDNNGNCVAGNDDDYRNQFGLMPRIQFTPRPGIYHLIVSTYANEPLADAGTPGNPSDDEPFDYGFQDACESDGQYAGFTGSTDPDAAGPTAGYLFNISGPTLADPLPDCFVYTQGDNGNDFQIVERDESPSPGGTPQTFPAIVACRGTFPSEVFGVQIGLDESGLLDATLNLPTNPWTGLAFLTDATNAIEVNTGIGQYAVTRRGDTDTGTDQPRGLGFVTFDTDFIQQGRSEYDPEPLQTITCDTLRLSDEFGTPISATCADTSFEIDDELEATLDINVTVSTDGDMEGGFLRPLLVAISDQANILDAGPLLPPGFPPPPAPGTNSITLAITETGEDEVDTPVTVFIEGIGHVDCYETFGAGFDLSDLPNTNVITGTPTLLAGDATDDYNIDQDDFDEIVFLFGQPGLGILDEVDINADGIINVLDLVHVGRNFGTDNGGLAPDCGLSSVVTTP